MEDLGRFPFIASFVAGILTFISPCILPLIPAYLSFITGSTLNDLKAGGSSHAKTFWNAFFFVLGFSLIFILLGVTASFLGNIIAEKRDYIRYIGGALVVLFGLHIAGILPIKLLYHEKHLEMRRFTFRYLGSLFVGITFAIGWTPCVGPILSSILILASAQETVLQGTLLLVAYSMGLAIPFLITALFINKALAVFSKIKVYYRAIEIFSGLVLVAVGVLILTGSFDRLSGLFTRFMQ